MVCSDSFCGGADSIGAVIVIFDIFDSIVCGTGAAGSDSLAGSNVFSTSSNSFGIALAAYFNPVSNAGKSNVDCEVGIFVGGHPNEGKSFVASEDEPLNVGKSIVDCEVVNFCEGAPSNVWKSSSC